MKSTLSTSVNEVQTQINYTFIIQVSANFFEKLINVPKPTTTPRETTHISHEDFWKIKKTVVTQKELFKLYKNIGENFKTSGPFLARYQKT